MRLGTASIAMSLLAAGCFDVPPAVPAPETWRVVYEQDFTGDAQTWFADFVFSDPERWSAQAQPAALVLRPLDDGEKRSYQPPHRSPHSIALLADVEVRDFDLECELLQTSHNYGHRDMCLFFGFESPSRYYYTHLATSPDPHAHNIFRVDEAPRVALAPVPSGGIDWGRDVWRRVRVERRVDAGTIAVYWDGSEEPTLIARCPAIGWGRIGFGTFDDSGMVRNVVLRADQSRPPAGARNPFE